MPKILEFGFFSGNTLLILEQVLNEIYLPYFSNIDFIRETVREGKKSTAKISSTENISDKLREEEEEESAKEKYDHMRSEMITSKK